MHESTNTTLIRRYYREIEKDNLSIIDELFSPDFISQSENMPSDLQEIKRDQAEAAFATESSQTIDNIFDDGDKVTVYLTIKVQLLRPFSGQMPDGRWHIVKAVEYWRIQYGKIIEYDMNIIGGGPIG